MEAVEAASIALGLRFGLLPTQVEELTPVELEEYARARSADVRADRAFAAVLAGWAVWQLSKRIAVIVSRFAGGHDRLDGWDDMMRTAPGFADAKAAEKAS